MPEPNWIFSPVVAELERVVEAFRTGGKVARHVTLQGLLDAWSGLVAEVERGYEASIYEYANDVDSRPILDRVASSATPEARESLHRWLQPWDERYETATVRATAPFHGTIETASRWHWRIPRRLVGELKSDLVAMGLAPSD